ncbi:MAG: hypothetical protein ACI8ZM_001235 [Crocinitomix sp.]
MENPKKSTHNQNLYIMKNLLLVFALLCGSLSFSQGVVVTNNTQCVKYVRAEFVMPPPGCATSTASPSGWVALAPGATLNFGGTHISGTDRLLRITVTSGPPPTCVMIVLDNVLNTCWAGPVTGSGVECGCEDAIFYADITNDGYDNFLNIHY